ncbi:TusE/DsrC/DsvC family sulfur relay protein [Croceimicrobium sp.]|uniref:TusE/DsrC/DsvC family sulfur relay protein n=1 Tax=Croceimicrobium sp. TaxID=2828340 RepID=UPI003BAA9C49
MEATIAGQIIDLNNEGYLTDLKQWNKEVAAQIAQEEGIELTDGHWPVIEYLQEQYRNEVPLSIRKVGKSGVVDIKQFYALFPGGPLKKASRIAGIPKPASCI